MKDKNLANSTCFFPSEKRRQPTVLHGLLQREIRPDYQRSQATTTRVLAQGRRHSPGQYQTFEVDPGAVQHDWTQ